MNNDPHEKRLKLLKASVDYAKSLFEFHLVQKEKEVKLQIKIEDEPIMEIDLNKIESFGNIRIDEGTLFLNNPINANIDSTFHLKEENSHFHNKE